MERVVVIGAGVGGMSAAALLAKRGYDVTVCEAGDVVGGRARQQTIEGYSLPVGAVSYQLLGALPKTLAEVGATVDVRPVNSIYFWLKGGDFVALPGRGGLKKMLEMFLQVQGKGGTKKAIAQVGLQLSIAKIGAALGSRRGNSDDDDLSEELSFRDWMSQHTDNADLKALFHGVTSVISQLNDFEYPAKHWFAHMSANASDARFDQFGVLPGGFGEVCRALAHAVEACGGRILLGTRAERIDVSDDRATGVRVVSDGVRETLPADIVVSNAGPLGTLALASPEAFTEVHVRCVRERVRPTPIVATFTVSDEPLFPHAASVITAGLRRIVTFMPITNVVPEWAPDGKHLTAFYGTPKSCLEPLDHDEERAANIADVHDIFPDFAAKGGRVLEVQVRDIDDPDVVARSWPGRGVPVATPVANVFDVGDAAGPPGYVATPAAAASAVAAVEAIVRAAPDRTRRRALPA